MTTDIYKQHEAAFSRVSAFVILDAAGSPVAKVAFKFPADGAGRLYAYTHFIGLPMTRAYAGGYGYDKRTLAVVDGFAKAKQAADAWKPEHDWQDRDEYRAMVVDLNARLAAFMAAFADAGGEYWDTLLRRAGFQVVQAV